MQNPRILIIHSSAQRAGSLTREISEHLADHLNQQLGELNVRHRDLEQDPLPLMNQELVTAFFSDPDQRTEEQKDILSVSDQLINELKWADQIIIGSPIYNFSVPARLKAWIDLICRAGVTFKYTNQGPVGELAGKKAWLVVSSGGTPVGSDIDYNSGYLSHIMNFIGITDVSIIRADGSKRDPQAVINRAKHQIQQLSSLEEVA